MISVFNEKSRIFYCLELTLLTKLMLQNRDKCLENFFIKEYSGFICTNHERVFYSMKEIEDKTHRNINSISNYEGRIKILCHPHKNDFSIDKYFLLCRILHLLSLVSYNPQISDPRRKMEI